jgi:putative oxidoreductase
VLFRKLIHTSDDHALALVRLIFGVVFFAHGVQKALGWFGGSGFDATLSAFTHRMGIPPFFAVLAILAEFLGGIGLILGLLSRLAAFGVACNMVVAIAMVHGVNGLFMNWSGRQLGEGFEYHLLAIAISMLVMARGAGAWSVDYALNSWIARDRTHGIQMEPHASRG